MASPVINQGAAPDFDAMTVAQLRDEALRLAAVLTLCNDQRRTIFRLVEQRKATAAALLRVRALSETEKDALRTVLGSG